MDMRKFNDAQVILRDIHTLDMALVIILDPAEIGMYPPPKDMVDAWNTQYHAYLNECRQKLVAEFDAL